MAYRKLVSVGVFVFMVMACLCLLAGPAQARDDRGGFIAGQGQQGFQGPGPNIVTVQEVRNLPDDSRVALRGNIVQHLGGEDYAFQDATGTISVDIDDKRWRGQTITPQDTVEITGKVDHGWFGAVEIDVKSITKVK